MIQTFMKKQILEDRLKELGLNPYKVAKEIARIKGDAEQFSRPTRYATAVRQALENPNNSSLRTVESLIAALGGRLYIEWDHKEEVVTSSKAVQVEFDPND
jgi:SOS-response transcriptional repressor LexA